MITIACACGLAMGLAGRCNKIEKQLDRIESKISSANDKILP
jgi:hypothetical protein